MTPLRIALACALLTTAIASAQDSVIPRPAGNAGTVTAVSGTAPVASSGGATPAISVNGLAGITGAVKANGAGAVTQAACADLTNAGTGCTGVNYGDFGASFTGNGSALASGAIAYGTLTVGCTIAAWNISASPADTATFDIWILGSPTTAIATVSNTVTASALPAISTGTYIHSTTLTSWTTTVAANSSYAIKLTAVGGTATYANLKVQCR